MAGFRIMLHAISLVCRSGSNGAATILIQVPRNLTTSIGYATAAFSKRNAAAADDCRKVNMGESQAHGFAFERDIREKVFGLYDTPNYIDTHDIPKAVNKFNANENVSIKTAQLSRGNATVCLGSAARISAYDPASKHTAIVVLYTQQGASKVVAETLEFPLDDRAVLFGGVSTEEILDLERFIRAVPNHEKPVALIRAIHAKKRVMNARSGVVKFNPKIDGKTQRRLQCSIPGIYTVMKTRPAFVQARSTEPVVRGVGITGSIASSERARRKKSV